MRTEKLASGGVRHWADVARASGVFAYRQPDGSIRREYRPAEEMRKAAATLQDAPVTVRHPTKLPRGLLTPDRWKEFSVGHSGAPLEEPTEREGAKWVTAPIVIHDGATQSEIGKSLTTVSLGVEVKGWDPTPGVTPDGEPYDGTQKDITINHVALYGAGEDRHQGTQIRLDAADDEILTDTPPRKPAMKITIDGVEYDTDTETFRQKWLQVESTMKAGTARLDSLTTENADLKTKLNKAEAERDHAQSSLTVAQLSSSYGEVLGADYKFAGKSAQQVRLDALDALEIEIPEEKKANAGYVEARLDAAITDRPAGVTKESKPGTGRGQVSGGDSAKPIKRTMVPKPAAAAK